MDTNNLTPALDLEETHLPAIPDSPEEPAESVTPKRRSRKKADLSQSEESTPDSLELTQNPEVSHDGRLIGDLNSEDREIFSQSDIPPRRRRPKRERVVAIDDTRETQTEREKMQADLLDLVESQKARRVLSGTIQGLERPSGDRSQTLAVLYHGAFKVLIPAAEVVTLPLENRNRPDADIFRYMVTKRLGAEIDYLIKGIDADNGIAVASRLEAMALKRRAHYSATDRNGNFELYEGAIAEARVVSVIRAGIFVDVFGVETYIPLRELSYQRWSDAAVYLQTGQRVLVKITALEREGRDGIHVEASMKAAVDNPYERALRRYSIDSRYVGTVSMVDTNGVFVALDGGIDCLCSYPKRGRPPRGARVTVRILGINYEANRIWGAITHMSVPR